MTARWLFALAMWSAAASSVWAQTQRHVGFLVPHDGVAAGAQSQAIPYTPRPGDLVLCDSHNKVYHFVFKLANTEPPTHSAMVIERADGSLAMLDLMGPYAVTAKVVIVEAENRLKTYPGDVMVRRLREPLTPEQSRELTQFAEAQVGKRFAVWRAALQATPFCPRSGWRRDLFGATYLNRDRWFCSELMIAAGTTCKMLDGKKCLANATYPHDMAFDKMIDLSAHYHPLMTWAPTAPAQQFARPTFGPPQAR